MTTMTAKRRAVLRERQELNQRTPRPVPEPARGALQGDGLDADHPVTIIPQVYRGLGGRRIFVAEMGDGWGVVTEDEMGRRQALKRFTPWPRFETAQEDLDAYAEIKGFQAEKPLPPDEGEDPEPAPVRRRTRDNGHAGGASPVGVIAEGPAEENREVRGPELPQSDLVPLDQVRPSPYQTRKDFPEGELRTLGESLRRGQLVPIRVRICKPGDETVSYDFELVAGERRVRAARLVGLKTLRAEVVELSDEEARWEVGADNEERRSFNAIERAHWFKSLLDAGMTQEDLAKRLGWAGQASVSNAVRLLRLPAEPWHRWISAEMLPASHVRAVLPYVEYPTLLAAIAQSFVHQRPRRSEKIEFGSYGEFGYGVRFTVRKKTRPLEGKVWDEKTNQLVPIFNPTPDQRARLGIVEVDKGTGPEGAAKEERAVNVGLWKTWHAAFLAEWRKTHAARAGKAEARAGEGKPKKLTKRQAESRAKEAAEKYEKRLEGFRADWLRWLLSERLRDGRDVDVGMVLGLALYFAASRDCAAHVARWLAAMFWAKDPEQEADHPGQPVPHVPAEDLKVFAVRLGIGVEEAWQREHCGPLTRRFWEIHSKEQLVGMIEHELGWAKVFAASRPEQHGGRRADMNAWTKVEIVEALLALRPTDSVRVDERGRDRDRECELPMPAELRPARRGPGRRKKD